MFGYIPLSNLFKASILLLGVSHTDYAAWERKRKKVARKGSPGVQWSTITREKEGRLWLNGAPYHEKNHKSQFIPLLTLRMVWPLFPILKLQWWKPIIPDIPPPPRSNTVRHCKTGSVAQHQLWPAEGDNNTLQSHVAQNWTKSSTAGCWVEAPI